MFLEPICEIPLTWGCYSYQHLASGFLDHTHTSRTTHELMGAVLEGDPSIGELLERVGGMLLNTGLSTEDRRRDGGLATVRSKASPGVLLLKQK